MWDNELKKPLKSDNAVQARKEVENCLVLQYHRVATLCFDPLQLSVEPYHFEEQIEYLLENFNVISIDEMRHHIETSKPFKQRTIVITFDGGYTDILYTANDVLKSFAIPATVFVTTSNIIEGGRFWWQELEDFLIANKFGSELELQIDTQYHKWPLLTKMDRFRAYEDLYSILLYKTPFEQREITKEIAESLELHAEEIDNHRTMSAHELKQLADGGLITIGGHTHNCTMLSNLSKQDQINEIVRNKEILEEVLGCDIEYFSHPYGSDDSCTMETTRILHNAGFKLAFCNSYGAVNIRGITNRYELPRVKVGNWNKFAFYRFISNIFD